MGWEDTLKYIQLVFLATFSYGGYFLKWVSLYDIQEDIFWNLGSV